MAVRTFRAQTLLLLLLLGRKRVSISFLLPSPFAATEGNEREGEKKEDKEEEDG